MDKLRPRGAEDADCVSVAHLGPETNRGTAAASQATNGRMTPPLMNALTMGALGGSERVLGGLLAVAIASRLGCAGAVYGFMTVFWCCSQTDAPHPPSSESRCTTDRHIFPTHAGSSAPPTFTPSPMPSHRDQLSNCTRPARGEGKLTHNLLNFPIELFSMSGEQNEEKRVWKS